MKTYRLSTKKTKVLSFLNKNRGKWFFVSDFTNTDSKCFIGYKANSRIAELVKDGFVITRLSDKKSTSGKPFSEYSIHPDVYLNTDFDNMVMEVGKIKTKPRPHFIKRILNKIF